MKKSRSSVPRFADRCELAPPPPAKNDGLFATGGRPDPELPPAPAPALVAIAVGKTKDGESFPANPYYPSAYGSSRHLPHEDKRTEFRVASSAV